MEGNKIEESKAASQCVRVTQVVVDENGGKIGPHQTPKPRAQARSTPVQLVHTHTDTQTHTHTHTHTHRHTDLGL